MTDKIKMLALYGDINPAADGVDTLEKKGVKQIDMEVITGSPINPEMLGRHHVKSRVPKFALAGSILGLLIGIFLAVISPNLYKIYVGGKPLAPGAPTAVVLFEMIMLFMLIATFIGVFYESVFPSYQEKEYVPEISDGDIAVIFPWSQEKISEIEQVLLGTGAKSVRIAERQQP